ncbi:hypothetical protein ACLB2K_004321 [Fragaria x ananassa]
MPSEHEHYKRKEKYLSSSSWIDMSLRCDESTGVAKPDGSNKTERRGLRFPFSPCEPGYLDRHVPRVGEELLPKRRMRMGAPPGELLPKRRIFLGPSPEARKNLGFIITPKSKELYKNLSSSIDMSLRHDESTAVTKPDGSNKTERCGLRFPFSPCEPGYLDRHPLPIPPPRPEGEELLPKRRMRMGAPPDEPEGGCRICSLDEHCSTLCPYNKSHIPKNAIVGRGCDVVCMANTGQRGALI